MSSLPERIQTIRNCLTETEREVLIEALYTFLHQQTATRNTSPRTDAMVQTAREWVQYLLFERCYSPPSEELEP